MNPYLTGTPAIGTQFYGRQDLMHQIYPFDDSHHYFLNGIRRIGKTSILKEIERRALEQNFLPLYIELQSSITSEDHGKSLSRKIINRLGNAQINTNPTNWVGLNFEDLLEKWVLFCSDNNYQSFLLIDEAERLHQMEEGSIRKINDILKNSRETIKVIITGTRQFLELPEKRSDLVELLELLTLRYVGLVSEPEAKDIIAQQKHENPLAIIESEKDQIYGVCNGHPFLLHRVCDHLFEPANYRLRPFVPMDFPMEYIEQFFIEDFKILTDEQKRILIKLSERTRTEEDLKKTIKSATLPKSLGELKRLGILVEDQNNTVRLSSGLFKEWIYNNKFKKRIHLVYDQGDFDYREKLITALAPLKNKGSVDIWDRARIMEGNIEDHVRNEMKKADIVLFLLSPNFLNNDDIQQLEVPLSEQLKKETGLKSIPIYLTQGVDTYLEDTVFAGMVSLPEGQKSIDDYPNKDGGWATVFEGIKAAVEAL